MKKYDVIHFEALGEEAGHLEDETRKAILAGELPADLTYCITPENLQDYLSRNPDVDLPDIITTKTHSVLPDSYLKGRKKSIITRSAGYDHFEHLSAAANITSLREYCVGSVAQTAIKFLYATTGLLNHYTVNAVTFERNKAFSFMELGRNRVATVFGVGKIGKRIYDLAEANGLTVQAVDIRQSELEVQYRHRVNFVTKEQAVKNSDIMINAMNLTRNPNSCFYNQNYFSGDVFEQAKQGVIFINVTRGEIAPESVLLEYYQRGVIGGIGLDVFTAEEDFSRGLNGRSQLKGQDLEAAKILLDCAENRSSNIYVQPHQAFNSDMAAAAKAADTVGHLKEWYRNGGLCFDEQLPYYADGFTERKENRPHLPWAQDPMSAVRFA